MSNQTASPPGSAATLTQRNHTSRLNMGRTVPADASGGERNAGGSFRRAVP